jgi:hypothetical protein
MLFSLNRLLSDIQKKFDSEPVNIYKQDNEALVNSTGSPLGMVTNYEKIGQVDEMLIVKKNAYLESFLIHSRVLTEFFFFKPNKKYIRVKDFFQGQVWEKECNKKFNDFLDIKKFLITEHPIFTNVSQEVAHIVATSSRTTWERNKIFINLDRLSRLFIDIIDKSGQI